MVPFIQNKRSWKYPPDVMYFDEWPVRHSSLLFGGLALDRQEYLRSVAETQRRSGRRRGHPQFLHPSTAAVGAFMRSAAIVAALSRHHSTVVTLAAAAQTQQDLRPSSSPSSCSRPRRSPARMRRLSRNRATVRWRPGSAALEKAPATSASGCRASAMANGARPSKSRPVCSLTARGTRAGIRCSSSFLTSTLALFYKVGPDPRQVVGRLAHVERRRPDVERRAATARRHPRADQEQAGAPRRRHDHQPEQHRVERGAEPVARPFRAIDRQRQDLDSRAAEAAGRRRPSCRRFSRAS